MEKYDYMAHLVEDVNLDEMMRTYGAANEAYQAAAGLDLNLFMATIGLMIDRYAADHGIGYEEMHNYLESLVDAHTEVNAALGEFPTFHDGQEM